MFFKTCTAGLLAVFLLSACAHRAPKPYGKPFPINAKQVADSNSRHSAIYFNTQDNT